jgi:hypothetical protein
MKALLIDITFALAMLLGVVFASRAFAADGADCPHSGWKKGHYVCGDIQNNS